MVEEFDDVLVDGVGKVLGQTDTHYLVIVAIRDTQPLPDRAFDFAELSNEVTQPLA